MSFGPVFGQLQFEGAKANAILRSIKMLAALDEDLIDLLGKNMDWFFDIGDNAMSRRNKLMSIAQRPEGKGDLASFVETDLFSRLNMSERREAFVAYKTDYAKMSAPVILKDASLDDKLVMAHEFGGSIPGAQLAKAQKDGILVGLSGREDIEEAVKFYAQAKNQTQAAKDVNAFMGSVSAQWQAKQKLIERLHQINGMMAGIKAVISGANLSVADDKLKEYLMSLYTLPVVDASNVGAFVVKVNSAVSPAFIPAAVSSAWSHGDVVKRKMMNEYFMMDADRGDAYQLCVDKSIIDPLFNSASGVFVDEILKSARKINFYGCDILNVLTSAMNILNHLTESASLQDRQDALQWYLAMPEADDIPPMNKDKYDAIGLQMSATFASWELEQAAILAKYDEKVARDIENASWQHKWVMNYVSFANEEQENFIKTALGNGTSAPEAGSPYKFISDALWAGDRSEWAKWLLGANAAGYVVDSNVSGWLSSFADGSSAPGCDLATVMPIYANYRISNGIPFSKTEILSSIGLGTASATDPSVVYFDDTHVGVYNAALQAKRQPSSMTFDAVCAVIERIIPIPLFN
jgi:hypothetical protein